MPADLMASPEAAPPALEGPLHLQLVGSGVDLIAIPPAPLGARVFLQPGAFAAASEGLPPMNLEAIPLPEELLRSQLLLRGYQLWTAPEGGELVFQSPLPDALLLSDLPISCLPPCTIQPQRPVQPLFRVLLNERSPAPGWSERVFLYRKPSKPFEASAVLYLDGTRQVAAVELFDQPLRPGRGRAPFVRRCWVSILR